jgi:ribonuclease Y
MTLVGAVIGVVAGFGVTVLARRRWLEAEKGAAERVLAEAEAAARETVLGAKDQALQVRDEAERETKRKRRELDEAEERFNQRREKLDRRVDQTESRARNLDDRERKLDQRETSLGGLEAQRQAEIERVAGLSRQEAKVELLAVIAEEARNDAGRIVREIEADAREAGEDRAREIVITCIQRCATDVVSDTVSSTVVLPSEEMKGRIIGRQGAIRAFEQVHRGGRHRR